MVILKISASFFIEAGVFSFSELGLMRGATLFFFLALLVVVGTGRGVCLKSNLNNVVTVEWKKSLLLAAGSSDKSG